MIEKEKSDNKEAETERLMDHYASDDNSDREQDQDDPYVDEPGHVPDFVVPESAVSIPTFAEGNLNLIRVCYM